MVKYPEDIIKAINEAPMMESPAMKITLHSSIEAEWVGGQPSVKQYKKKPVVIEALQFNGDNFADAHMFSHGAFKLWEAADFTNTYYIETLEGDMNTKPGDYIVKGVKGEFYTVDKDIFLETYEEVEQ